MKLKASFSSANSLKVFYNTVSQFVGRLVILLIGLLSVGVLTRYLGVADYGRLSVILAYLTVFYTLSDWGIGILVTKEAARNPDSTDRLITTSLLGRLIFNIGLGLIAVAAAQVLYAGDIVIRLGIALMAISLFTNVAITTYSSFFQIRLRNDLAVLAEVIGRIVGVALLLAAVSLHWNIYVLLLASLGNSLIQAYICYIFARLRGYRLILSDFEWTSFVRLFRDSIVLGLALVVGSIYFKVDIIILSLLKSAYDVGIYSSAYKILEIVLMFPTIFAVTIFPLLVRFREDTERFAGAMGKAFRFMLLFGAPVVLGGFIMAPKLMILVGGQDFLAASTPLRVLLASGFISSFNTLLAIAMISLDRQRNTLGVNIFVLIFNVTVNFLFIPHFGYMAAAWNNLASELIVFVVYNYLFYNHTGIRLKVESGFKAMGATGIMGVFLWLTQDKMPVLIEIFVAAVIYGLACFLVRAVNVKEVKELVRP